MRHLIFAIAIAAAAPALAGERYDVLRAELIAEGWVPAHRMERLEHHLYPEATACAGSGKAPCIMEWAKKGKTKRVFTVGEPPNVDRVE